MAAEGEFIDGGTLTTQVEDTNLGAESLSGPLSAVASWMTGRTLESGTPRL